MSHRLLSFGLSLCLMGMPGCFSHIPFQDAPVPTADQTVFYIYRPDSPPALRKASVFINDQQVGELASKQFTWITVPAGSYILHVKWSPELFISPENINVHIREKKQSSSKSNQPRSCSLVGAWSGSGSLGAIIPTKSPKCGR